MCDGLPGIFIEGLSPGTMMGMILGSLGTKLDLSLKVLMAAVLFFVRGVPLKLQMNFWT